MKLTGKRIWSGNPDGKDEYVDFTGKFSYTGGERVFLRLSCDSNFVAWINGKIAAFGACSDYPQHREYDVYEITRLCERENVLDITVWHYGDDSSVYIASPAFLLFDVTARSFGKETVLLQSGKNIFARKNPYYKSGYCKKITNQLGYSFFYDACARESEYLPACELSEGEAYRRKRLPLRLLSRVPARAERTEDGYIVDLGKETVGFLELEFETEKEGYVLVSYGERLDEDGSVPRKIEDRDFSVEYRAKAGKNVYLNCFRRIAGRYLEIRSEEDVRLIYAGIRPVVYPLRKISRKFSDETYQKIYDVCVYTLQCCMHEHYEDCPWREQALYTMDSRNQMLCGYYAFEGSAYQRANLLLIARGQREDGFLPICFPAGLNLPIPFFSLVYLMQLSEYVQHTGDRKILLETGETAKRIMHAFSSRVEENGLIADLPVPFWNFYEWSEGSDDAAGLHSENLQGKRYHLCLNCMYVYAAGIYTRLTGEEIDVSRTKCAIRKTFFVSEKGLYKLTADGEEKFGAFGNSLAILAGLGDETLARKLMEGKDIIPVTLSMVGFFYDALLSFGEDAKKFVLEDIRRKYGKMLAEGATTFWETEDGWRAFNNAGSLCHGWSALPIVYLCELLSE